MVSGEPSFRSGDEAKEHKSERLAKGVDGRRVSDWEFKLSSQTARAQSLTSLPFLLSSSVTLGGVLLSPSPPLVV